MPLIGFGRCTGDGYFLLSARRGARKRKEVLRVCEPLAREATESSVAREKERKGANEKERGGEKISHALFISRTLVLFLVPLLLLLLLGSRFLVYYASCRGFTFVICDFGFPAPSIPRQRQPASAPPVRSVRAAS